tara:strand:- start:964 stop:1155 length:192 start_codon:yes stop_codon:yes gene_type:complete
MKQKQIKKPKEIAQDIVNLTRSLDSQQELKKAWKTISLALSYLSSKDSMYSYEKEIQEMQDAT